MFSDDTSGAMWKKNVKDIEGEVLCVSQFTLFASTSKGKPDFHRAMVCILSIFVLRPPRLLTSTLARPTLVAAHISQASGPSRDLYGSFLKRMGELYRPEKIQGAQALRGRIGACRRRHATAVAILNWHLAQLSG